MYVSLEIIRKISILLNPIIPNTTLKVLEIFNLKQNDLEFNSIKNHESLKSKNKIKKIDILFKKIEKMIDSHCHLDHEPMFSDLKNVIIRSKENGLEKILSICTTNDSFKKIIEIIKFDPIIYGTFGIHPHETSSDKTTRK